MALGSLAFAYAWLRQTNLPEVVLFLVVLVLFTLIGQIAAWIIRNVLMAIAKKTKSEFDDLLLEAANRPVQFILFLAGIWFGLPFLSPGAGLESFVYRALSVIIILDLAWFFVRIFDGLVRHFLVPLAARTESKLDDQLVGIVGKIGKVFLVLFALLYILSEFGYDVSAVLAGLGIGGIALAFAAQATIADVFGGFSIFTARPFQVGDVIEFGNVNGTVKEIGLRYSRVLNFDGRLITVPNSTIAKENVVNWSSEPVRRVIANLGLVYETPAVKIEKAREIITKIVKKNPLCGGPVTISFDEYKDYSLNLVAVYFVKTKDHGEYADAVMEAKNQVNLEIKRQFEKNGIEFAFPTQTVYLNKNK